MARGGGPALRRFRLVRAPTLQNPECHLTYQWSNFAVNTNQRATAKRMSQPITSRQNET